jgi:hypothetical protein
MLEHARAGDGAVLGHVAHDHHAHVFGLRETHQLGGAFAQLRHRAGGRAHRRELHGLDGIDDQQADAFVAGPGQHRLEVGIRDHTQSGGRHAEAPRTHPDLGRRLFPREVQGRCAGGGMVGELQQQRGLADPGLAT